MDHPTHRCRAWRPPCFLPHHHHHLCFCPHRHHHHHPHHFHHHHCHHHHHHPFNHQPHQCPNCTSYFPQNPEPFVPVSLPNDLKLGASACKEAYVSATQILQEQEQEYEGLEEEEDDEPVFVLTDEWREFFLKSEAKRKLEKKQAKKKGKQ